MNLRCSLYRWCLVLVLCCVLFLNGLCVTVQASDNIETEHPSPDIMLSYPVATMGLDDESVTDGSLQIASDFYLKNTVAWNVVPYTVMSNSLNGSYTVDIVTPSTDDISYDRYSILSTSNTKIISKGSQFDFELTNLQFYLNRIGTTGTIYGFDFNPDSIYYVRIHFRGADGSYKKVDLENFTYKDNGNGTYNFGGTVEAAPCDTYGIIIDVVFPMSTGFGNASSYYAATSQGWRINKGFQGTYFNLKETTDDGTKGLLRTIIEFLKSIVSGITELPSKIWNAIKGGFDSIVNGLINLGNFIIDGIKGLFVPSEEDITVMQDKWNELLEDRFGALYQTIAIIDDYANSFTSSEKNTVTFPTVNIPVADSNFQFGGYEVQVVPTGFDVLITPLKTIISIIATFSFINAMKNRLEKLVGGSSSI